VPIIAEKRDMTPSHSHHITARYGLFTLILLGESLFASANPIIEATPRQLELFGFPPPGHPYWNMDTFTGMEQRYPNSSSGSSERHLHTSSGPHSQAEEVIDG
jgi:hypothetical protein